MGIVPLVLGEAPDSVVTDTSSDAGKLQQSVQTWGREVTQAMRGLSTSVQQLQQAPAAAATKTVSTPTSVQSVISAAGANGWTPSFALVPYNGTVVLQLTGWTGGTGAEPASGMYVGPGGFVSSPAAATNLIGPSASPGGLTFQLIFSALVAAPPAAGGVLFDNATFGTIANVYVSETDRNGVNIAATLAEIGAGGVIEIFQEGASTSFATFAVTSATAHTGYYGFAVTPLSGQVLQDLQAVGFSFSIGGSSGGSGTVTSVGPDSSNDITMTPSPIVGVGTAGLSKRAIGSIMGNNTGATAKPIDLTPAQVGAMFTNNIANTALAQMPAFRIKGNNTNATANAADLTVIQMRLLLADAQVFNVVDYGADPTGAAYSDTAIAAALSAAITTTYPFILRFPAGFYKVKTQFAGTVGTGQSWSVQSQGFGPCFIRWDAGLAAASIGFAITIPAQGRPPTNSTSWSIEGITFSCQTANTGIAFEVIGPAANYNGVSQFLVNDCYFAKDHSGTFFSEGFKFDNGQSTTYRNTLFSAVTGLHITNTDTVDHSVHLFEHCQFNTGGTGAFFDGTNTGGFEGTFWNDCNFVCNTCIQMTGCAGEDHDIHDSYMLASGAGNYFMIDIEGVSSGSAQSRIWVHDCFFDFQFGVSGNTVTGVKIRNGAELFFHNNLFAGSAVGGFTTVGFDIDTTTGGCIHDNRFETLTTDIKLGASSVSINDYDNKSTNAATPRTIVRTDAGTNNLTDIPVAVAALPTGWPIGTRAMVNNAAAAPAFLGVATAGVANLTMPVFYNATPAWVYG
jgi:Pectate lyase superfamily protein